MEFEMSILWLIYPPFTKEKNPSCSNVHPWRLAYCSNVHPGGRGSDFFFVRLYLYNKQPPKKYLTHGAWLTICASPPLVALPYGCPTLRLPFLKVALPLVGQALWLLPCIYSYEVEAVWCGFLMVGFDCIMGANKNKRKLHKKMRRLAVDSLLLAMLMLWHGHY